MELKEKWGLKEGWCWNDNKSIARECLLLKKAAENSEHLCMEKYGISWYKNFSETDPNKEELKVGEFAYFWDNDGLKAEMVRYSRLILIDNAATFKYRTSVNTRYEFCSHINPLLK